MTLFEEMYLGIDLDPDKIGEHEREFYTALAYKNYPEQLKKRWDGMKYRPPEIKHKQLKLF